MAFPQIIPNTQIVFNVTDPVEQLVDKTFLLQNGFQLPLQTVTLTGTQPACTGTDLVNTFIIRSMDETGAIDLPSASDIIKAAKTIIKGNTSINKIPNGTSWSFKLFNTSDFEDYLNPTTPDVGVSPLDGGVTIPHSMSCFVVTVVAQVELGDPADLVYINNLFF